LVLENPRLNELLDNRDDMFRKTNKEKRAYMSLLGEAKEKVIELESLLVDARAQVEFWKPAPIVTDEPECTECPIFLGDLIVLRDKSASKVEELDVIRVDLEEMKSRPSLLGAYTSCPILHAKFNESHAYARSLEAASKNLVATSCSTCELHAVEHLELADYVDRLQDDNGELRKMMGWLLDHEPELRMMIEAYKCYDGQALGSDKIGEGSGEKEEKIGDIPAPPKIFHKTPLLLSQTHLGTDYTQPQIH
jgi:hypothetical protein